MSSTTDAAATAVEVPVGEAGPSWPRAKSWNSACSAAGVVPAGEAPGIAKRSAIMKPEPAETSGEVGPLRSRVNGTNTAAATADAMPADDAGSYGMSEQSATTVLDPAETSGEAGLSWSRANGMNSAAAIAEEWKVSLN